MLIYLNQKRGQSTLEYAVLTVIIIGALLSIQFYIKRGVQGRLKSATDDIGDQYSVGNTNVLKITHTEGKTTEKFTNGASSSVIQGSEITNKTAVSVILNTDTEYMGHQ